MKYIRSLFLQNYLSKKPLVRPEADVREETRDEKRQSRLKTKDDILQSIKSLDGRAARNLSSV